MSSVKTLQRLALGAFAVAALGISPGSAQTAVPGFTASTPSSVAGCPYIIWRLARNEGGAVHGMAYYSDLSGMSFVRGQVSPSGDFTLDVTSTEGAGPSGRVTGHIASNGSIQARMVGQGCANMEGTIYGTRDLNTAPRGGNGGG